MNQKLTCIWSKRIVGTGGANKHSYCLCLNNQKSRNGRHSPIPFWSNTFFLVSLRGSLFLKHTSTWSRSNICESARTEILHSGWNREATLSMIERSRQTCTSGMQRNVAQDCWLLLAKNMCLSSTRPYLRFECTMIIHPLDTFYNNMHNISRQQKKQGKWKWRKKILNQC